MALPGVNDNLLTMQIDAYFDASHTSIQILRHSYFGCEFRLIWLTFFTMIITIIKRYINIYCQIFFEILLIENIEIFK